MKIKEFLKKYLIGFILGVLSAAVVVVYAETYFPSNQVTYDNTESGMNSDNVQTAIDELYNTCFPKTAGDQILEDQPLEKDPYECRYFFTGGNPNNYITFNNESWRIISIECDGRIKIMRDAIIVNQYWDTNGSDNWSRPASLNTVLNRMYNVFNSEAKSQIVESKFSIGAVTYNNNNISSQVTAENSTTWNGKIALATLSEYIRTNSNKSSCGTFSLINKNHISCLDTGWMDLSTTWWTLTPSTLGNVFYVDTNGSVFIYKVDEYTSTARPVLYISSEVQIIGGDGSQSNPYQIG